MNVKIQIGQSPDNKWIPFVISNNVCEQTHRDSLSPQPFSAHCQSSAALHPIDGVLLTLSGENYSREKNILRKSSKETAMHRTKTDFNLPEETE